jgi:hypothetical protein
VLQPHSRLPSGNEFRHRRRLDRATVPISAHETLQI